MRFADGGTVYLDISTRYAKSVAATSTVVVVLRVGLSPPSAAPSTAAFSGQARRGEPRMASVGGGPWRGRSPTPEKARNAGTLAQYK